ncbi:5-(carboxyamino)imidazole ribonucleotide synthase [Sphingobium algorifonticola]|uniref:N5-carboxyaminoimidazole ribonucleotide synthase n=1 Tax=Sphingobium algorifonticola TaxID=2008318 RepID=A0A437JCT2_9SPHN|nr:5-(carboxyamino)imidazole ribonucleotide synthase [Sphingobium algorifonticola]RVT43705.1 5-(carboxyamino)imidazole ribonucleotide synthase [Sphingobium algorifonticola]
MTAIAPGATIGILGGGQLGRMIAIAAAQLGYRTHIYAPEASGPAADVSPRWTEAAYTDADALARFADSVDVVTYEFENIDTAAVDVLSTHGLVRPGCKALRVAQDRLAEKRFVDTLGGMTAPFMAIDSLDDLDNAIDRIGCPAILKTNRMGYDGKGQARIMVPGDSVGAWNAIHRAPAILEGFVTFEQEFSVIAVRGAGGEIRFWDSPANVHLDGILATSTVPAGAVIEEQTAAARALTRQLLDALDYVGVLAVEFFASAQGPVFNEMAPRVHNSGHWTIEGAITSQFENHVRAICGLPLGDTGLAAAGVSMRNLIADQVDQWPDILADPSNHLHLYGKGEARPGRKMGHVTRLVI